MAVNKNNDTLGEVLEQSLKQTQLESEAPRPTNDDIGAMGNNASQQSTGIKRRSFGRVMPMRQGGGSMRKMVEYTQEQLDLVGSDIKVYSMDKAEISALAYSCLLFTTVHEESTYCYVAILGCTGEQIAPMPIQNSNVLEYRTVGSAMNIHLKEHILDKLSAETGSKIQLVFAGDMATPLEVDVSDEDILYSMVRTAYNALNNDLQLSTGWEEVTLRPSNPNEHVSLTTKYAHGSNRRVQGGMRNQVQDFLGMPKRVDITATTSIASVSRNQQNVNYVTPNLRENDGELYTTSIIAEMLFTPPIIGMNTPVNEIPTQQFTPHLIINGCESKMEYTPNVIILNLLNTIGLASRENWLQFYNTVRGTDNSANLTDVGALNYICKLEQFADNTFKPEDILTPGMYMETASDFGMPELKRFMNACVTSKPVISLDIARNSTDSWFLDIFDTVATHHDARERNEAANALYDGMVQLTDGNIQKHYPRSAPIFAEGGVQLMHTGYYMDNNNVKTDIATIDLQTMLSMYGESNLEAFYKWTDTFCDMGTSPIARANDRWSMLQEITNHTAVHTGYTVRLTFHNELLTALVNSMADCGAEMFTEVPVPMDSFNVNRHNSNNIASIAGFETINGFATANNWGRGNTNYAPHARNIYRTTRR